MKAEHVARRRASRGTDGIHDTTARYTVMIFPL